MPNKRTWTFFSQGPWIISSVIRARKDCQMGNSLGKAARPETENKGWAKFRELFISILWAVFLALLIRTFVVQPFKIPSGSMENTLLIGDHLLANKFIYGFRVPFTGQRLLEFRAPERGDIIVFRFPKNPSEDFIKRIIGIPGDVIQIKNKQVFVNGVPYNNPHAIFQDPRVMPASWGLRDNFGPVKVPPDSYFVMGDNRDFSYDSRYWGVVKKSAILGEAMIIYWSWKGHTWHVRWGRIGKVLH
jgi:signal peptidase I